MTESTDSYPLNLAGEPRGGIVSVHVEPGTRRRHCSRDAHATCLFTTLTAMHNTCVTHGPYTVHGVFAKQVPKAFYYSAREFI